MSDDANETLKAAISKQWPHTPGDKAKRYIGKFIDPRQIGTIITGKVVGNYGTYTVSIRLHEQQINSACSCYIGKHGDCHHCAALALTFLHDVQPFQEVHTKPLKDVKGLEDISAYLQGKTLERFLDDLKAAGVTQKMFAESIGMSTRHLAAIKSSELRNRYYHELGATKLACLWVLEHFSKSQRAVKEAPGKKRKAAAKRNSSQ